MSVSVEERLKGLMKKYEIPEQQAFNVKTLVELQKEYEDMPKDKNTLKNRQTLIQTISYLQGDIGKLKKKFKYEYNSRNPYVLLVVMESVAGIQCLKSVLNNLVHIGLINMQNVLYYNDSEKELQLEFDTGLLVRFVINDENLRGVKCNDCINTTSFDEDVREKVSVIRGSMGCKWD